VVPAWSPSNLRSQFNGFTVLADGGMTDNSGVIALIRRGVKHVIAVLHITASPCERNFGATESWPSLFGRAKVGISSKHPSPLNARSQIFRESGFDELTDRARMCSVLGKPVVVQQALDVIGNPRCGVAGGYRVEVCWVFNAPSDNFTRALPCETQFLLHHTPAPTWKGDADRDLAELLEQNVDLDSSFPYSTTLLGNYSRRLIRMHSECMAFNFLQGVGESGLQKIFGRRR